MIRTLQRLREMKSTKLARMVELNNRTKEENRDLTEVEQREWNRLKESAEDLVGAIELCEREHFEQSSAPAAEGNLGFNRYGRLYVVDGAEVSRRLERSAE